MGEMFFDGSVFDAETRRRGGRRGEAAKSAKNSASSFASPRLRVMFFSLALTLSAQSDPARQFEAAVHREIVSGDVPGALAAYRALASASNTPRSIAGRALLQLGQCQEKLGQRKDAHTTYARIVREFADEKDVASQAQTRLAGWTDALPGPRNLRFEEGDVGKVPPGWWVLEVGNTTGNLAELHRKGC